MRAWTRLALAAAGGIAGSAAASIAVGSLLWHRATARAVRRLHGSASLLPPESFSLEQLRGLPEPVARFFQFALTPGQPLVRSARVEQRGQMRIGGFEAPWSPMSAIEQFSAEPPGFVWDATLRMAGCIPVRVRDAYLGGAGSMQVRLASLIPVVDQYGRPELNAGALHRYLAEAVWLPTALLPGRGLTWEPIDNARARATLRDAGSAVSLEFQFDASGAIERACTPARYREVAGRYVPTPWVCSYGRYEPAHGMQIPMEGEVEWLLPEGPLRVWRGRIVGIDYQFGR